MWCARTSKESQVDDFYGPESLCMKFYFAKGSSLATWPTSALFLLQLSFSEFKIKGKMQHLRQLQRDCKLYFKLLHTASISSSSIQTELQIVF